MKRPPGSTAPPEVVHSVLEALDATQVRWAALSKESELAAGIVSSDIDVVVGRPVAQVAEGVLRELPPGLVAAAYWPYDVGTGALFICPTGGGARVQLDLAYDPRGRGKYGFRSDELLGAAAVGVRWPMLNQHDALLYELRKRIVKRDNERAQELFDEALRLGLSYLRCRAEDIFTPRAAATVVAYLQTMHEPCGDRNLECKQRLFTARRYLGRLHSPTGFWIHLGGGNSQISESLRPRLEPLLPHVRFAPYPEQPPARLKWWVKEVAPVRWRPGLLLSYGPEPGQLKPDYSLATLGDKTVDPVEIIGAMADRTAQRLKRLSHGATT